jgi:flagellar hook-basal body complex protein FliE
MSLPDFIAPVAALPSVEHITPTAAGLPSSAATATQGAGFSQMVTQGLDQVNAALLDSQVDMQRMAAGEVGNLHQVMLRMEESRLSFQMMVQVRNRLLESYQELMRMQV